MGAKDRLLRLINIIISVQNKPGVNAGELAENLCVSKRQVYRDISDLSAIVPIYSDGNGYYYSGQFAIYPLRLSKEETIAYFALPGILGEAFELLSPEFHRAYDKISAVLVKEQKISNSLVEEFTRRFVLPKPIRQHKNAQCFSQLIDAMFNMFTVNATYNSRSSNNIYRRFIDPYYIVFRENRLYLIGYCHLRGEIRTFRLSRFIDIESTGEKFDFGDFSLESYLKDSWSIERGEEKTTFLVRFSSDLAPYIQEEEFYSKPKIWLQGDGSLLFQATASSPDEFMRWLLQYGPGAELIEPERYRKKMKDLLDDWHGTYGR